MRTSLPRLALAAAALVMLIATGPAAALISPSDMIGTDVRAESSAQVTSAERDQLTTAAQRLADRGAPTKFLVLGKRPGSGTDQELRDYAKRVRVTVGSEYSVLVLAASPRGLAIASKLPQARTNAIFQNRISDLRADPVNGTVLVAQDVASEVLGADVSQPVNDTSSSGGSGGGTLVAILGLLGLGGVAIWFMSRRARKRARQRVEDQRGLEKALLDPLVDGLAAQINDLDPQMQVGGPGADAAKADYQEAVLTYADARAAVERAQTPAQIGEARQMLEKGLRAARRAQARLEGRPVEAAEQEPLLEGLCTFDPKHGKAVGEATVTAPDGRTAQVPVCADCMRRMQEGQAPEVRQVQVGGRNQPYWQGGGGMGGLLNGALLGILLGGMFGGGSASGDQGHHGGGGWPDQWGGDSGGGFGGDAGGGSFGGGDFGGGDAGGGSF